jgi:hypothetical protein
LRDTERVARIVFGFVTTHVSPGETEREVRTLWPQPLS